MMKSIHTLLFTFMFLFMFAIPAFADNHIPNDVDAFARSEGIKIVKEGILADPIGYGYSSEEEVNNLVLGEGRQLYYVNPEKLKEASGSLFAITEPREVWAYLLLVDGVPKSKMIIDNTSGTLEVSEFGGNPDTLATAFQVIAKQVYGSETLLISSRGQFIVATKTNSEENVVIPELVNQNDVEAESTAPLNLEVQVHEQKPDEFIKALKETQSINTDEDGSGSLYTPVESNNANWLVTISIGSLAAILAIVLVIIFLRHQQSRR